MSGELRTSQFRWTTTADDDFVIGNPNDITDTTTKALVFQTTTTPGFAGNPHFRCEYTGVYPAGSWSFVMSPDGATDIDFTGVAYLAGTGPQAFTGNNTFSGTVGVSGALTASSTLGVTGILTASSTLNALSDLNVTSDTVLGGTLSVTGLTSVVDLSASGTLGVDGVLSANGALNVTGLTTVQNLTVSGATTTISSTAVTIADNLLTLNKGLGTAAGSGIEIEESSAITSYFKTSADRASWILKSPTNTSVVTLTPGASSATLTFPAVTGTLALKAEVINQPLTGYVTAAPGTVLVTDSIIAAIEKLDGNINAIVPPGGAAPWVFSTPNIYFATGGVSIGTANPPPTGAAFYVVGGHIVNYGHGLVDTNTAYGVALSSNTSGGFNTAIGNEALVANTTGYMNTAVGYSALTTNITGYDNTAVGHFALKLTTANDNTAFGNYSLGSSTTGTYNTGIGSAALKFNVTGGSNTAVGYYTGGTSATACNSCTFIGYMSNSTGNYTNSTALGANAQITASNQIVLGDSTTTIKATGNITVTGGSVTGCQATTVTTSFIPAVNLYDNYVITATSGSALTIGAPTGMLGVGQTINIIYIQPVSGSIVTPTWNAVYKFFGTKNISTTLAGKSLISCMWDGAAWLCSSAKDPA